jgi:AcrR family transcriptional regulator
MVKNPIQEARMKSYFIASAKQIIKSEGIRALSVRTVAQKAGYSYATLYNYFNNLRDLIFVCVNDFLREAEEFIQNEKHPNKPGIKRIESLSLAYCKYFVQYFDIFALVYTEQMPDIANTNIINSVNGFFDNIFEMEWDACFVNRTINKTKIDDIKAIHKAMLNGMLLFYINRGTPAKYDEFIKLVKRNIKVVVS